MTEMPLSGNLEDVPFAEVAGSLFREKKTGTLTLASGEKSRRVIFYEGNPVAVVSDDPKDHIARFLAAKGKIAREDADKLLALPETKESLQSADFLSKEILTWGVKFRFVNLAYDFFRWEEGTFSFEDSPPPKDIFLMKVPTPSLLVKGVKHMSPSNLMQRVPGDMEVGPGIITVQDAGPLGQEETALLSECREGRKIQEIIDGGSVDPGQLRGLLYAFAALGVISVQAPTAEEEAVALEMEDAFEPTTVPPEDEPPAPATETAFEIERHSYEEEPAAAEGSTLLDTPGEPDGLGPGVPPPPDAASVPPPAQEPGPMLIGQDDGPPPPAPVELEPPSPEMPPSLDEPVGAPPPLSPDLPPPPWQEEATVAEEQTFETALPGPVEEGTSPFSPPDSTSAPKGRPKTTAPSAKAPEPKRRSGPLSRIIVTLALVGALAVVGAGLWFGSEALRSPSSPLPPIPPIQNLPSTEMAEDIPVPALPGSPVKTVPAKETPAPAEETPPPETPPTAGSSYDSALAYFEAGDHQKAASAWSDMLIQSEVAFTVQVVVACQIDTVKSAFLRFRGEKIFAVPLKLSGRSCFRVCFGTFTSSEEAEAAISGLAPDLQSDMDVKAVNSIVKRQP